MSNADRKDTEQRAKPFAESIPPIPVSSKARKQQVVRDAISVAARELFHTRGFEGVTVEEIAQSAGISRRTFFRYYESKEDVMVEHLDQLGEQLLVELAARPLHESPLLAIRNALVPSIEFILVEPNLVRDTMRLLRATSALRRAVMEHRSRLEERIAALMVKRMNTTSQDNTPMLLAFLTRALNDLAFNAWYDHETDDIAGLIDDLVGRLCTIVGQVQPEINKPRKRHINPGAKAPG